ncbi:NAD-dependent epimerase/dehydratase family protein [Jannaschia pohangensis]|uniref:NAD dependent epimerase/dehydratase family protein n=1 Tax=Jannaschia pohangensis TaxID=390807 RepID=A0A1I3U9K8_9RHOB|nr:SDR family oxidoreductase [Jannaschia pohangensis]SFJ79403.1 NAD dependent epimerase/dehydratase family protein [Jannaschia pohangensis]
MSDAAPPPDGLAVTGSTGRIGRMLRTVWAGADVAWLRRGDPLETGLRGRSCVVGLAGVTRGDARALAANTSTACQTLRAAEAAKVKRVILFSSAAVYGRASGPLVETAAPTPVAPYGTAKAEMEENVARWCAAHPNGPEVTILRLGNVAGADALLSSLDKTPPGLDIFPDGRSPRRSYIGPRTLAEVLVRLAIHPGPLPEILNVAAPGTVEMAALLRAAALSWTPMRAPPAAIPEVELDTRLLQSLLPLPPDASDPARIVAEWREVCR